MSEEDGGGEGGRVVDWTGKVEIRRAEFLAAGEACKAIFRPAAGSKKRTWHSSELKEEGIWFSAPAVLHLGGFGLEAQDGMGVGVGMGGVAEMLMR